MSREAKLSVDMMPLHRTQVSGIGRHNERTEGQNHSNPDIDDSRTHLNYSLIDRKNMTLLERVDERITDGRTGANSKRKIQSNAILLQSHIIQVNDEYFAEIGPEKTQEFFKTVFDHYCQKFGRENIVAADIHMDEKSPHIHIERIPLINGRLVGGEFRKKDYAALHTDAHKVLKSKGFEVLRGESKNVDKERVNLATYKARELTKLETDLLAKENALNASQAILESERAKVTDTLKAVEQEAINATQRLNEARRNSATVEQLVAINQRVKQVGGLVRDKKIEMSIADFNTLSETARAGAIAVEELPAIKKEWTKFKIENPELKKENQHLTKSNSELISESSESRLQIDAVAEKLYVAYRAMGNEDIRCAALMLNPTNPSTEISRNVVINTIAKHSPDAPKLSNDANIWAKNIVKDAENKYNLNQNQKKSGGVVAGRNSDSRSDSRNVGRSNNISLLNLIPTKNAQLASLVARSDDEDLEITEWDSETSKAEKLAEIRKD